MDLSKLLDLKTEEEKAKGHKEALLCASYLFFVLGPAALLLRALALRSLWGWFVTPTFGVAAPGIVPCMGILFLGTLFWARSGEADQEALLRRWVGLSAWQRAWEATKRSAFDPLTLLLIGWALSLFL